MRQCVNLVFVLFCIAGGTVQALQVQSSSCGDQSDYTEDNGVIVSHSGLYVDHNYGKNIYCIWKITAPEGMHIQLSAMEFDIEPDSGCAYDSLELMDGNKTTSPSMGKFCGDEFTTITSSQRYLTLMFSTDNSDQYTGFKLFYNFTQDTIRSCLTDHFECDNERCVPGEYLCDGDDDCGDFSDEVNCTAPAACEDGEFQCVESLTCIQLTWKCDGANDCSDSSDEENCPVTQPTCADAQFQCEDMLTCIPQEWYCDGGVDCADNSDEANCGSGSGDCSGTTQMNGTSGRLTSPFYPQLYPNDRRCVFIFNLPESIHGIRFVFESEFELEPVTGCGYDSLSIRGVDNSTSPQLLFGPYCGDNSPGTVDITGHFAEVTFISDDSHPKMGYAFNWEAYE